VPVKPAESVRRAMDRTSRSGDELPVMVKPVLHQIGEPERLSLLHRILFAATLAVNHEPIAVGESKLPALFAVLIKTGFAEGRL